MLPSFRVRNLRRPPGSPTRSLPGSFPRINYDAIVRITAPEYDSTISDHPEATLNYVDEDDGELITVGSSLELCQRLQEPLTRPIQRTLSSNPLPPSIPSSPVLHAFDISGQGNSLKIWQEIEERSKPADDLLELPVLERDTESAIRSLHDHTDRPVHRHKRHPLPKLLLERPGSIVWPKPREDDLSVQIDASDDASHLQELEDYRTRYFRASNPPQLHALPRKLEATESTTEEHLGDQELRVHFDDAHRRYPESKLTLEGRRQAQAAGDKIRSRSTPLRADQSLPALNRWANYYVENNSSSLTHNSTLESRRQAQFDANTVQAKTRPVCFHKPARVETECALNGNRSTSCDITRPLQFNELPDPTLTTTKVIPRSIDTEIQPEARQPLLEVFEAELSKLSVAASKNVNEKESCRVKSSFTPSRAMTEPAPIDDSPPATDIGETFTDTVKVVLDGVGLLTAEVKSIMAESQRQGVNSSQHVSQVLEQGLRGALGRFGSMQNIADSVQKVSSVTRHAAYKARDVDVQVLDGAVNGFRGLAEGIASLGKALILKDLPNTMHHIRRFNQHAMPLSGDGERVLVLWPIPDEMRWTAIKDLVLDAVPTAQVEIVNVQEKDEESPRTAFCTVSGANYALQAYLKLAGFVYHDSVLTAALISLGGTKYGYVAGPSNVSVKSSLSEYRHSPTGLKNDNGNTVQAKPLASLAMLEEADVSRTHHAPERVSPGSPDIDSDRKRGTSAVADATSSARSVDTLSLVANKTFTNPSLLLSDISTLENSNLRNDHGSIEIPRASEANHLNRLSPRAAECFTSDFLPVKKSSSPDDYAEMIDSVASGTTMMRQFLVEDAAQKPAAKLSSPPSLPNVYSRSGSGLLQLDETRINETSCEHRRPFFGHSRYVPPSTFRPSSQNLWIPSHTKTGQTKDLGRNSDHTRQFNTHRFRVSEKPSPTVPENPRVGLSYSPEVQPSPVKFPRQYQSNGGLRKPLHTSVDHGKQRLQPSATDFQVPSQRKELHSTSCDTTAQKVAHETYPEANPWASLPPAGIRFPTLEQFEGRNFADVRPFPPLPSMEPLIPSRAPPRPDHNSAHSEIGESSRQRDPENPIQEALSQQATLVEEVPLMKASSEAKNSEPRLPKDHYSDWSHESNGSETESSGEFFKRMTGLSKASKESTRSASPVGLRPAAPNARLAKPFDPLAETATANGPRDADNIRRSATVVGMNPRYAAGSRRPYSEYFSGNGRMNWDSFLDGNSKKLESSIRARGPGLSNVPVTLHRKQYPQNTRARGNMSGEAAQDSYDEAHSDASTVSKVQQCVEQLKDLGFGNKDDGGVRRLVVYAQAAEGDLFNAIDMIDEEQRAYKEWI